MISVAFREILPLLVSFLFLLAFLFGVVIWVCLFRDSLLLLPSLHLVLGLRFWVPVAACLRLGYWWWICSLGLCSSLEWAEEKWKHWSFNSEMPRVRENVQRPGKPMGKWKSSVSWGVLEIPMVSTLDPGSSGHSDGTYSHPFPSKGLQVSLLKILSVLEICS